MHIFYSMHLRAFPPKGWNVGPALVFIQVSKMHVHDMWGMPPVKTEILVWEKIQLQRKKNRFRAGLGSCQNMSRNMLKNPFPIFSDTQNFESVSDYLWNSPTIPRESCKEQKGQLHKEKSPLGGGEIQLLSHLTFRVHLTSLRHDAWCFLKQ